MGVGHDVGSGPALFNPAANSVWTIAEQLSIGDENSLTLTLIIDSTTSFTSNTGRIGTDFGGGEGIVEISGGGSSWTINGALDARNGLLSVIQQGTLETGTVSLGDDDGEMRAGVDGNGSIWTANGNVDIGPSILTGSGQGNGLTVQNDGLMTVGGNVDVHGTSTLISFVVVDTNGTLTWLAISRSAPSARSNFWGARFGPGSCCRSRGLLLGATGTLDLTDQDVIFDSALSAIPLAANTLLQNDQTLILNGVGRNLTVGQSATGQLDLMNTAIGPGQ